MTNNGSNTVSILLGVGDGTFAAKVDYATGNSPQFVITGLFNNDAYLDLVIMNISSNTISVLLGLGDGTFAAKVDYVTGTNPLSVTTGLFNNDAYLDLAVANLNSSTVSIFLGVGDGTFAAKVDYVTGTNPLSVTTGLFNNDAYLDLALMNNNSATVSILLGIGDGTFAAKVDYATGSGPVSVTTGLFNNDAYLDLAVANDSSNTVSILLGVGDGTFAAKVDYATGNLPYSVTTGLFNNDAYLDLVIANYNSSTVSILLGIGDGTFATKVDYATGNNPRSVTTGLFNNDVFLDLAVANWSSNTISILLSVVSLSYSGNFSEEVNGSLVGSRVATLNDIDTFVETLTEGVHYNLTNKPAGLTAVMTVDAEGETATLTFTGTATSHSNADDVSNLTITFLDGAFTNTATASEVTNYTDNTGIIDFIDTEIEYSGNFVEDLNIPGQVNGSRIATLTGDTFIETLTEGEHYSLANKPAGLTAVMTVDAEGETATLTFTGTATSHSNADDVSNLTITFLDGAFTNTATASNVTNYTDNSGVINFYDMSFNGITTLYGADGSGGNSNVQLYILDPNTGDIIGDPIGLMGHNINGMDFHPETGILYGNANSDEDGGKNKSLFTIDTTTGAATWLGTIKNAGGTSLAFPDIAFRSDGTLYGWSNTDYDLYTISIDCPENICLATKIGEVEGSYGGGIDFDSEDNLYLLGYEDDGYWQIDPDTGEILEDQIPYVNYLEGGANLLAAKFDGSDNLFAVRSDWGGEPADLVMIDVETGEIISTDGSKEHLPYMTALAFKLVPADPTCSDGIQNQDETGIDTGGVCIVAEPESQNRTISGSSLAYRQNFLAQQQALLNQNIPTQNLNFTRNLKIKTKGNDVKDLQSFLNTKLNLKLITDGIFGPLTRQAVIRFQLANGLVGDGIVGKLTQEKLKSMY